MKNLILRFSIAIFVFVAYGASIQAQTRSETFAITNARIVTVSGAPIERGTVVVRDGLIESVGANLKAPADARIIDGSGLTVYPGLIDANTNLGLSATPPAAPTRGQSAAATAPTASNSNYPAGLQPEESAIDGLKSGEAQFETVRNAGFTTALIVSKEGLFNGRSAIINLAGDSVGEMTIRPTFAEHFTFTTLRTGAYPTSLMGTFSVFRQMLLDAQRLQILRQTYDKNPRGMKRPEADKSLEALIPILNRQMPIVFNANTEREIIRSIDLAKEFNLNAIISGGQEAWKVSDRLKAANIPVLLSLNFPKRTSAASPEADAESMELLRLRAETPKTAARLASAGVKFAFQSGGMTNINDFLTNANKATENGLSKDAAIRAMTLSAAEIFGLDNRLGTIEAGKIADLTVMRGDIFSKGKTVTHVIIDGKLFEQKDKPKTPATGGTNAANISGGYTITIQIPGQSTPATLIFNQQGEILTGTIQGEFGTAPLKNGKATVNGFSFAATVEFGGQSVDLDVSGTVTGNQISGTITTKQGAIPFSGTKNP
ncbi:MAG: amidohydrolase family protein [Acidobacteriota bacterium]|nr:amidohydrolase family protein [Acidobacteriota bacterium]